LLEPFNIHYQSTYRKSHDLVLWDIKCKEIQRVVIRHPKDLLIEKIICQDELISYLGRYQGRIMWNVKNPPRGQE
jgi:hypothetical protein